MDTPIYQNGAAAGFGLRCTLLGDLTLFSGVDLYIEDPKISRDGSRLFDTRGRRTGAIVVLRRAPAGRRAAGSQARARDRLDPI